MPTPITHLCFALLCFECIYVSGSLVSHGMVVWHLGPKHLSSRRSPRSFTLKWCRRPRRPRRTWLADGVGDRRRCQRLVELRVIAITLSRERRSEHSRIETEIAETKLSYSINVGHVFCCVHTRTPLPRTILMNCNLRI